MNKKALLFICFVFCLVFSWSESFKIGQVEYEISGITMKSALEREVPIDTNRIFNSEEELNQYLIGLEGKFTNLRVFDAVEISITSIEKKDDYSNVSILVYIKDSWNIMGMPYPSFDSNTGLKLKLKIKDYNFFGSLKEFEFAVDYEYALENSSNYINLNFKVPFPSFKILTVDTAFLLDFDLSYAVDDLAPGYRTGQSLVLSKKINNTVGINFAVKNDLYVLPTVEDIFYFEDTISLSFPINLTSENSFNLVWKPNINFNFIWNFEGPNKDIYRDVSSNQIHSSALIFGHNISSNQIEWLNNFKNGYSFSIDQLFSYKLKTNLFTQTLNVTSKEFKAFNQNFALYAQQQLILNIDGLNTEYGNLLRGIKNSLYETNSTLVLNFDLPIKALQTDWVSFFDFFGLDWKWTRVLDFELQINPFFDMALGYNINTGTTYLLRDGYYSNGFELLLFPNKMKSITGRVSLGFDTVKTLEKIGNKSQFVDKITHQLFNTEWRDGTAWELFIGVGLFY